MPPALRTSRLVLSLVLLASLAGAALAAAATREDSRQDFSARLSSRVPGTSTGIGLTVVYHNPDDPSAKPPPVARTTLKLPAGSRIDTSVPGRCTATDAQLQTQGPAACPAASRIGDGSVDVATGLGPPATAPVAIFNTRGGLILLARVAAAQIVTRGVVRGRFITISIPPTPGGPPDNRSALNRAQMRLLPVVRRPAPGARGRPHAYLTTPRVCPRSRHWVIGAGFRYGVDGHGQTRTSLSPCRPAARRR